MIKNIQEHDWPQVKAIYIEGIRTGEATFETVDNVPDFATWYRSQIAKSVIGYMLDDEISGWGALLPVSQRKVYAGVAEVSIYVRLSKAGLGIGTKLLEALIDYAENNGIWTLQSTIFPENKASVALHQKMGFRVVGYREKIAQQYGRWRNTLLLERRSTKL